MEYIPFHSQIHRKAATKNKEKSQGKTKSREGIEAPGGCHDRGIHHSLTVAATTAHSCHQVQAVVATSGGRSHFPAPLPFGAYFIPRVLPMLGHFGPLFLSSLIL